MRTPFAESWRRRGPRGRVGVAVLCLLALGSLVAFVLAAVGVGHAGDNAAAFAKAPVCSAVTGANSDCLRQESGRIIGKETGADRSPDRLEVSSAGGDAWLDFPKGDAFLHPIVVRDAVTLDLWHGTVAAVEAHGGRGITLANPSDAYRRDKAIALYLLALAMFCIPLAMVSVMSDPGRRLAPHRWTVFGMVFSPLAGIVLMASAGTLADGLSDPGGVAVAVACFLGAGIVAWWVARWVRRAAVRRATAGAVAAPRVH